MDIVGKDSGDSRNQVHRYIRLTHLIPSILQMVDEYQIAFNPAVEISYLTEEHQRMLKEEMDACQATPSLTQSRTLKQMSQSGTLTREYLHHLLTEEKPNQRQKFFSIRRMCSAIFPSTTPRSRCSRSSSTCSIPGSTNAAITRTLKSAEGGTP